MTLSERIEMALDQDDLLRLMGLNPETNAILDAQVVIKPEGFSHVKVIAVKNVRLLRAVAK
jgi:hypothetical protein